MRTTDNRHKLKAPHDDASNPVTTDSAFNLTPNKDSSLWTFDCFGPHLGCFEGVRSKRADLEPWFQKILGHQQSRLEVKEHPSGTRPIPWKATWKSEVDSGQSEPGLASLVKFSIRVKGSSQSFFPVRHEKGWDLCPQNGCPKSASILNPVSQGSISEIDLESQSIKVLGPVHLVAPEEGWIADVQIGQDGNEITLDHPRHTRTVFYGDLKWNGEWKRGQYVGRGKSLAYSSRDSGLVRITHFRSGSPELPGSWKGIHGP